MIVDDAKFMTSLTEKLLKKIGHEIAFKASNGIEAINFYSQYWSTIDIILLDLVMPKMDGIQTLKSLKSINPRAKIIIITSISSQSIVTSAMRSGASEFITKPFRLSEFVRAINKVIEGS